MTYLLEWRTFWLHVQGSVSNISIFKAIIETSLKGILSIILEEKSFFVFFSAEEHLCVYKQTGVGEAWSMPCWPSYLGL